MYTLKTSAEIARLIRHSHPLVKHKLKAALQIILDDPTSGKALKEELKGLQRNDLRSNYRLTKKGVALDLSNHLVQNSILDNGN